MITIIDAETGKVEDKGIRRVLKKTLPGFLKDANVLVVHADVLLEQNKVYVKNIRKCIEQGEFVLFYGKTSASVLCRRAHPVARLMCRTNTAYFQMPCSNFFVIEWVYNQMARQKRRDNPAMLMLAEGMEKRKKIGEFLKKISSGACDPHGFQCSQIMRMIKRELDVVGPIEKVRKELEELQRRGANPYIRKKSAGTVIPGIFCDLDMVGSCTGEVYPEAHLWLRERSEEKPVIIYTSRDPEEKEKLFAQETISCFPFVSIHDFKGCTVETVISSCSPEAFERGYGVKATQHLTALAK